MLDISNLSIKIDGRFLVRNLSFSLHKKDKLAVIGEEGNGKSTLLKAILGKCEYAEVSGSINLKGNRIGYLEQTCAYRGKVLDFLCESGEEYYKKVGNLYRFLEMLNMSDELLDRPFEVLSGGEKVKIEILKILLDDADILFLDEPTNDLDIETLEWLESFIVSCEKPIMYVSHDEVLLSKTANMILHLEELNKKTECRHTFLEVDYETYIEDRIHRLDKQTRVAKSEKREYERGQEKLKRIMQKVEHEQASISRQDPFGAKKLKKKMHSLKAQEKRLENANLTELPDVEESINFFFDEVQIPKGKKIISLDIPELRIGERTLVKNVKLEVFGNVHLCITGKNGTGKSTLLKVIHEELKNRDDIKVGYMPQVYDEVLKDLSCAMDYLFPKGSKSELSKASTFLSSMKLTRDEMLGPIENLSGGSKAKVILAKLVLDKCDVLVLDEPTRNVSPLSNPVIRQVLREFKGTIISVSHDRKYIEEVAREIYILDENGLNKV